MGPDDGTNPYQPSSIRTSASEQQSDSTILIIGPVIGSVLLIMQGIVVGGLGLLPSDLPSFFLVFGTHLLGCGIAGVAFGMVKGRGVIALAAGWVSVLLNVSLVLRVCMFLIDGTARGATVVAAPLLLGVPAVLNACAVFFSRRDNVSGHTENSGVTAARKESAAKTAASDHAGPS